MNLICAIKYTILCLICLMPSIAQASIISRHSFPSETLDRDYSYMIYLPDDYNPDSNKLFPVVYLLHGSLSDETQFAANVDVKDIFDTLIREGKIPSTLVVMPGSKSWWVDGYNEPAETAFINDFIPHIESRWRAIPQRNARIIGGLSAGGYGTVNFALKYPHMFAAAAAFSPASYEDLPAKWSSAYNHPTFTDKTGRFDEKLWRSLNYPSFIEDYKKRNIVVPFYINSGDHDNLDIAYHAAVLFQRLREHQPENTEFRVIDGGHEWSVWVRTLAEAMEYTFRFVETGDEGNIK